MFNQWFSGGLGFESGYPFSNNPFHKAILNIQTTGPQTTSLPLVDVCSVFHMPVWCCPLLPGESLNCLT